MIDRKSLNDLWVKTEKTAAFDSAYRNSLLESGVLEEGAHHAYETGTFLVGDNVEHWVDLVRVGDILADGMTRLQTDQDERSQMSHEEELQL